MRRREFITLIGGATAWPLMARVQQPAMPVVGFLNFASAANYAPQVAAFLNGLAEPGYVEGRNVAIEYRWAEHQTDRLPALAADLVHRRVSVIAATSTPAALAAKPATATIPVVFETGGDPIELGLVRTLNLPGGNITGVSQTNVEVVAKRLELMHELLPAVRVFALLVNETNPTLAEPATKEVQTAARALGLELHVLSTSAEGEFDAVFAKLSQLRAGGLVKLLKEIAPGVTRAAVLRDATVGSGVGQYAIIQAVAPSLGVELRPIDLRDPSEIERAIVTFAQSPNGGLIIAGTPAGLVHRNLIITLAAHHQLPAVYPLPYMAHSGGLIAYGPDSVSPYRRAAGYVDRIFKGEKPADLPVQAATKFELVINLKTAKALGLTPPNSLLSRANELIE